MKSLLKRIKRTIRRYTISPLLIQVSRLGLTRLTLNDPVFVYTTGRSGSYLIYDSLFLSPSFLTPEINRTHRINKGIFGTENWGDDSETINSNKVPTEGYLLVWDRSKLKMSEEGLGNYYADIPDNIEEIGPNVRELYKALHPSIRSRDRAKFRLMDKDPRYLSFWRVIDRIFPDAKYLTVFRDPRAVFNSYLRRVRPPQRNLDGYWLDKYGTWGPPPAGWQSHIKEPLARRIAWQVSEVFRGLLNFEKQINRPTLRVYYEKFVDSPNIITSEILDFLGAAPSSLHGRLPEFKNFNPPWFDRDGSLKGEFGKDRFFHKHEHHLLKEIEDISVDIGYDKNRIGILVCCSPSC